MDQSNKELKQTLINYYSKLSFRNSIELTERIKANDWWIKEPYRLKVQSNVSKIGYWFVILMISITIAISIKGSVNLWQISIPILSTFLFVLSIALLIKTASQVEEKLRLFEVMKLAFDKVEVLDSII